MLFHPLNPNNQIFLAKVRDVERAVIFVVSAELHRDHKGVCNCRGFDAIKGCKE
jgi:hypothetical protein